MLILQRWHRIEEHTRTVRDNYSLMNTIEEHPNRGIVSSPFQLIDPSESIQGGCRYPPFIFLFL